MKNKIALLFSTLILSLAFGQQRVGNISVAGSGGSGFVELANQSAYPSTPSAAARLFVDSANQPAIRDSSGNTNELLHQSTGVINVASIASLKAYPVANLADGSICNTRGYYAANDGGGGVYVWNSTSTATDNGGTVIQATGVSTGRWLLRVGPSGVSVLQFGAYPADSNDNSTIFANAIASGVSPVIVPAGTYKFTSSLNITSANSGINIAGAGQSLTTLKFYSCSGVVVSDAVNQVSNVVISGLSITANGTCAAGINLAGVSSVRSVVLCHFNDLVIFGFTNNYVSNQAFDNQVDNVYCNSSTSVNAVFGAGSNSSVFNRLSLVGGTQAATFTNCEGLQFNSPEISNQSGASSPAITLSQSRVSMINPYFENITSSIIASVGINAETTVKSSLTITGGQCNITSPVIQLNTDKPLLYISGLSCVTNDIVFFDTVTASDVAYSLVYPSEVTTSPGQTGFTSQFDATDEVFYGNKNPVPYPVGGGVSFVTKRAWIETSTSVGGRGFTIGSGLTIGNKYTVVVSIRGTAGNAFLTGVGASVVIPVQSTSDNWQVEYIPVTASATSIALAMNNTSDTLQIKLIAVIKGHKFPRFNIYGLPALITSPASPSVDTWSQGDFVSNSVSAVGQPKGWYCTVGGTPGTWVSTGNL